MSPLENLHLLTPLDAAALALLWLAFFATGWRIEHPGRAPSVTVLMSQYRRAWMAEFLQRDNRIFDSQILGSLRQGTSFFASTCLLAIGGVLALLGNTEPLQGVAEHIAAVEMPAALWQIKLLPVTLLLSLAFLKFVWAHRVFGYCAVMMAAVPQDAAHPEAAPRALRAGELNIRAAWNFNRGLRAMYFALAALAWLLGAAAMIAATLFVAWLLWSREFSSVPRDILLKPKDEG
ncbi:DUF599 domain-containing protein [Pseudoroseicyclus aestuarii]|uniref:Putative membrane protein n=1 Tax=Pseudoroseicyclus aestuarii TaxID=1795041 RepID=A0A318SUA2_9RHOB|nr:DUF599 domain-containing protein [Pseudoroseicyclus aestuarii]PYE83826.1 putative membrane protein [Pseudoroseicyclus aestuarii]